MHWANSTFDNTSTYVYTINNTLSEHYIDVTTICSLRVIYTGYKPLLVIRLQACQNRPDNSWRARVSPCG